MVLLRCSVLMVLFLLALPSFCLAGWVGPKEVVKGKWGTKPGEFGFVVTESGVLFPRGFDVDGNGRIFVNDHLNKRIQVFKPTGDLEKVIIAPNSDKGSYDAIDEIIVNPDGAFVAAYASDKKVFFDKEGKIIAEKKLEGLMTPYLNGYYKLNNKNKYDLYAENGEFITTSQKRPKGKNRFEISAKRDEGDFAGYIVELLPCRKICWNLERGTTRDQNDWVKSTRLEEESEPVVINNDIYIWVKTQTTFSILKWYSEGGDKLFGGPSSPSLDIATSSRGFYLSWKISPEDINCISAIEIVRAEEPSRTFVNLATVNIRVQRFLDAAAEPGKAYLYKVRAIAGSEYSDFSNEVTNDPRIMVGPRPQQINKAASDCDDKTLLLVQQILNREMLDCKNKEQLRLMRNEIYARHGKTFQSAGLQKYFSGKCWYKADPGYSDAMLTPLDRENIRIIQEAEKVK